MRIVLALGTLALLGACGGGSSPEPATPAPAPAPPAPAPAPVAPPAAVQAPAGVTLAQTGGRALGAVTVASSTQLLLRWTTAGRVDHFRVTATDDTGGVPLALTAPADATQLVLASLKAATTYAVTLTACGDAACATSAAAAPTSGATPAEHWQLQGSGNRTAGLARIVSDGNARISATRFGPEASAVTANRVQLYYGPSGQSRQILTTALGTRTIDAAVPASYLAFSSSGGTTGLHAPVSSTPWIAGMATGQGVPLAASLGAKVRLFFEAQGADGRTRIFSVDSADGYTGQDFHAGVPTACTTAADYSAGGGCAPQVAIGVEGDSVAAASRIQNARQHKVGWPTLTDWRWDGAAGTFMVFTVDRVSGCSSFNMNHAYAVWSGSAWQVQYDAAGCPKMFTSAQAAFPLHVGGARYKLYYGDPSVTAGRLAGQLPFLGPKKLIYADGARSGAPDRVDFEDWENQSRAREVVFLWPNGDRLDATAHGYIDDYHFLMPTGSADLQVMYMAITNGTEAPFGAAAVLLNP
ncbi:fibronectin type III domain-containing protein [Caenimonas sedimenti]|uniref:Fibronectin type III domain-containing protein n=1 Tax=Caenimonas sedimenti TaxID=2596921 RepID=A0A562ZI80_9BURK|nr:fibronectin type III domain-containing protein [Caenimonas sedimenti]TWO68299.1 fibronectin type III domain-containing protein [Caenimonas sedimenti]